MILNEARELAYKYHANQKYGDKPYTYHLEGVLEILLYLSNTYSSYYNFNTDLKHLSILALLHDLFEDTNIKEIPEDFNKIPCDVVSDLLLLTHEAQDSYEEYIDKMLLTGNKRVLWIKFSDLIFNFLECTNVPQTEKIKKRMEKYRPAIDKLHNYLTATSI